MSLELRDLSLRVGADTHVHRTSLQLAPKGFNTLLGETLSGKTTLLRLMAGLVKPTGGTLWFNGKDVTGVPVQRRRVSMVYQQFINYPNLSVFDNIASPLRVTGTSRDQVRDRVGKIAELLQLTPLPGPSAERAVGRPAAAHCAGARAGQGRRPGAARRAAGQPGLQAARVAARRVAAAVRRPRLHGGLRHHRAGRSAAAGRPRGHAARGPGDAVRSRVRRLPRPGRPAQRACLLRPADQRRQRAQGRAGRSSSARPRAGTRRQACANVRTASSRSACVRTMCGPRVRPACRCAGRC